MARLADLIAPELRTRYPDNQLDFGARQVLSMNLPDDLNDAERAALSQAVSSRLPSMTIAATSGMRSSHTGETRKRESYQRESGPERLAHRVAAGVVRSLSPTQGVREFFEPGMPPPATTTGERIAEGVGSGIGFGAVAIPITAGAAAVGVPTVAAGALGAGASAALPEGTAKQRAIRGGTMAAMSTGVGLAAGAVGKAAGPVAEKLTHSVGGPTAFGAGAPWAEYGISKVLGEDVEAPTARDIAEGMVGLGILGAASHVGAKRGAPGPEPKRAPTPATQPDGTSKTPHPAALSELGKGLDDTRPIPFAGGRTASALYKERIASIPPEATPEQAQEIASRARQEVSRVQEVDDALRPPKTTASVELQRSAVRIQERAEQDLVGKKVAVETDKGPAVAEVAAVRIHPYPDVEKQARLVLKDPETDQVFVQSYPTVADLAKAVQDPGSVDWQQLRVTPETAPTGSLERSGGAVEAGPAVEVGSGSGKPGQHEAADLARKMSELRDVKPRPVGKMFGKNGPTPEQLAAHTAKEKAWNKEYRAVSKAQKDALESGNAAHRAATEMGQAPQPPTQSRKAPGPHSRDATSVVRPSEESTKPAPSSVAANVEIPAVRPSGVEAEAATFEAAGSRATTQEAGSAARLPGQRPAPAVKPGPGQTAAGGSEGVLALRQPADQVPGSGKKLRPAMDQFRASMKLVSSREQSIFDKIGMENSAETAKAGVMDLGRLWHRSVTSGVEMLNRQGEPGQKLGADIGESIEFTKDNAGRDVAEFKRLGQGLTDAQREMVGKIMDGTASDPSLKPIADKVRAVTDRILAAGQEAGLQEKVGKGELVPLRRMDNWFRQVLKDEVRSKVLRSGTPENERQVEWMREQDPTLGAKEAHRALNEWMNLPGQIRAGLQHERAFSIAPEFREWNFEKVLSDYALHSWKRISQAKSFGADDAKAHELIQEIANQGGDAKAAADMFVGYVAPWRGELKGLDRALGSLHAITMLSTAGILQPSQMTNTAARTSFLHAFRGYAEVLNGVVAGRLELNGRIESTEAARRKAAMEWADETGVAITETVQDIVSRESKSLAGRHVRLIGLEPLDRINRLATALSARLWTLDQAKRLVRDPKNESVRRDLKRVGLDPEKVLAEGVPDSELRRIARQVSGETQFESSVLDLPSFRSSGTLGRVIYRFKSFAMQQSRYAKSLVKEAKSGNPAPLLRFLIGQATVNAAFGEVVQFIRRKERPDDAFWRWVEDMMTVSAIGAFGDVARSAASGADRFASAIMGPTFSELFRLGPEIIKALPGTKGDARPLLRHILSRTPLIGPQISQWLVPSKKKAA